MPYPSKTDRQTILATALSQVGREGLSALAIRSVAAELGLAPNALYRYFDNLAALKAALAEESRRRMHDILQHAAGKKPPEEAIRRIAQAYVRFAREEPHLFSLTLMPSAEDDDREPAHVTMWTFVLNHVAAVYGEEKAPEAALTLWAFLHGMTALEAAQVFGDRKPLSSFNFGLEMWIQSASVRTSRG